MYLTCGGSGNRSYASFSKTFQIPWALGSGNCSVLTHLLVKIGWDVVEWATVKISASVKMEGRLICIVRDIKSELAN